MLSFLIFMPPIIYATIWPQDSLKVLGLSGVFLSIILIIYPAIMAWKLRVVDKIYARYRALFRTIIIITTILFGTFIIFFQEKNHV